MSAAKKRTPEEIERQRLVGEADALLESLLEQAELEIGWAKTRADGCTARMDEKVKRLDAREKTRKKDPDATISTLLSGKIRKIGEDGAAEQIQIGKDRRDQRVRDWTENHRKTMEELGVTE